MNGSGNDGVWRAEREGGGNRFEFLCYRGPRKRLAGELEGQSDAHTVQEERVRLMDAANPRVILRNYIAQNAIEAAENGDFSEVSAGSEILSGLLLFFVLPHSSLPSFHFRFCSPSALPRRSGGSSKSWRSRTVGSQAWSFQPGRGAAPRLPVGKNETKVKSNSERRILHRRPEIPSPTTASRRPGPARSASHDPPNDLLDGCRLE